MSDRAARMVCGVALAAAVALAALTGGADDPARPGYGQEISHPQEP